MTAALPHCLKKYIVESPPQPPYMTFCKALDEAIRADLQLTTALTQGWHKCRAGLHGKDGHDFKTATSQRVTFTQRYAADSVPAYSDGTASPQHGH